MTPTIRILPRLAIAVAALTLAAPGCGSSEDSSDTSTSDSLAEQNAAATKPSASGESAGVLDYTMPRLDGRPEDLGRYRGKVVLVVNTATECGHAPEFGQLETLYKKRRSEGLVVLGFPADDVAGQEPRSDEEIAEFCKANFGVTFPMFSRINVVDDPHPLYRDLAEAKGPPDWNFNKYLLDRQGRPLERWGPETDPDNPELTDAIDAELAKG